MARALDAPHFEHDAYLFTPEGEYLWTEGRMAYAYRACKRDTKQAMIDRNEAVVVSNVFPTGRSMKNYIKLAEEYGYGVTYIVVENRRGGQNVHNVPDDVLVSMRNAFQVEL
jgi:hypothetical protein